MLFTHFSGHMAMIKWRIYGLPDPQSFGPKLAGQFPPTIIWCDLTGRHCVCVRSGSQNGLPLQCISSFRCNVLGTCYFIEVDTCDDIVTECSTVQFWRRVWLKEKKQIEYSHENHDRFLCDIPTTNECIRNSYTYTWVCGHGSFCHVLVCLLNYVDPTYLV